MKRGEFYTQMYEKGKYYVMLKSGHISDDGATGYYANERGWFIVDLLSGGAYSRDEASTIVEAKKLHKGMAHKLERIRETDEYKKACERYEKLKAEETK
jgi:hypothetical protein